MKKITTQYDKLAALFSEQQKDQNLINRLDMYKFVGEKLQDLKLIDLCCGDGIDCRHYQECGALVTGLDASSEIIKIDESKSSGIEFVHAYAQKTPFHNNYFDIVTSKYAIMNDKDVSEVLRDVHRILKPGGAFVYLATHPMRQYFERKKLDADYFDQEIVESVIFDGKVTLKEPTHTFNDYFSCEFFKNFMMVDYFERYDPAAEKINNAIYPGYFIVKAIKK